MVVLGFQLVSTLIGATTLSKIITHFSFGQWLLCRGLTQHLHPSNKQLKEFAGLTRVKEKAKKQRRQDAYSGSLGNGAPQHEEFHIAKSTPIELDTKPVSPKEVVVLNYYWDYQCLIDFTLCALIVYAANEIAHNLVWGPAGYGGPNEQTLTGGSLKLNLSLLWICLGILIGLRCLGAMTRLYLRTPERGEMMVLVAFTFFFLVLAMGIVLLPEQQLRLGVVEAHANFTSTFQRHRVAQDKTHPESTSHQRNKLEPVSLTSLRVFLVITGALLGGMCAYPGLRLARMYQDALRYTDTALLKVLLHTHFFWPILCLFFWVGSFREQLLLRFPRMTNVDVDSLCLYSIASFCLLRLFLMHTHLQAYLHMARQRVMNLRKEVGRISNVEFQKTVWSVFRCLAIVALQYVIPLQLLLLTACLYRNLAQIPWRPMATSWPLPSYFPLLPSSPGDTAGNATGTLNAHDSLTQSIFQWLNEDTRQSVNEWTAMLVQLKSLFTPTLFRGLLGFYLFWILLCVQVTSLFGLIYHSYMQ